MIDTATADTADITIALEAHHCRNRNTYKVIFEGPDAEQRAIDYIQARTSTTVINEHGHDEYGDLVALTDDLADRFPNLYEVLYPLCDHGLSALLCDGPNHYPADRAD